MYAIENASLIPLHSGSEKRRGLIRAVPASLAAFWRAHQNRRAIATLARLDSHMLADIGLTRGDVHAALAVPLGDDPSRQLARLHRERHLARLAARRAASKHV